MTTPISTSTTETVGATIQPADVAALLSTGRVPVAEIVRDGDKIVLRGTIFIELTADKLSSLTPPDGVTVDQLLAGIQSGTATRNDDGSVTVKAVVLNN